MKDFELYTNLTKLVNATFGTTGPGASFKSGQKANFLVRNDDLLEAKYSSLVTFTSDKNLDTLLTKFRNEGYALIEAGLKTLSKEYEEKHKTKLVFDIKVDTATETVDYAHYNIYNSTRRAFFRLNCLVNIKTKQ